jgi:TorA maturation chaperone TorD
MSTQAVSGNLAGKIGLADAPTVELALSRSKLYLLLSWGFLYPEEEEFYNYLQEGEFVEDGLAAIETLEKSLDATKATGKIRDLIAPMKKFLDQIADWEQENFKTWEFSDLQDEHRRVFSNVISLDAPPYETLFGNEHVFQQSHTMGDIAGYYKAFGLELAEVVHERLDHLSVELEFLHFLAYKESYALCHDGEEKLQIVVDAEKKFVRDHVGRWAPLFADMASKKAQRGFFMLLCELSKAYLKFECAYLGVTPQPYKETDYKPATFSPPEGASFECGAQDLGNELSVLLDEVGGRSQMGEDVENEGGGASGGPAGHA